MSVVCYFWFYIDAVEISAATEFSSALERYVKAAEAHMEKEPLPWMNGIIDAAYAAAEIGDY